MTRWTSDELETYERYRDRLSRAYVTALTSSQRGGRVEIHMGSDIIDHLRSLGIRTQAPDIDRTCWGFPVVPVEHAHDHLSVHTVETIP